MMITSLARLIKSLFTRGQKPFRQVEAVEMYAIVKAHWGEEARETSRLITAHYDTLVEGLDERLSEAGFLRLMDFLRTVFLQDAALLRRSYPDHEIFKDGLFGWQGGSSAPETWSSLTGELSLKTLSKLDTSWNSLNTWAWMGRLPSNKYMGR
jgi:hypothetical protein